MIRLLLIALVAGVIVAGGLIALEMFGPTVLAPEPSPSPTDDPRPRQTFADMAFSIGVPLRWELRQETLDGRPAVSFLDPEIEDRGFQVAHERWPLRRISGDIDKMTAEDVDDYDKIRVVRDIEVADTPALRHVFEDDSRRIEQWWVQRGAQTFRIEFWAPLDVHKLATRENELIVATFEIE